MLGALLLFFKKLKLKISLLSCTYCLSCGLIFLLPQFSYEYFQGNAAAIDKTFIYCLIYLALFPSIGSYYCWAGAVSIIGPNRSGIFFVINTFV